MVQQRQQQMLLQNICSGEFITSINNTNYYLSSNVKYFNAIHEITASTQIISYKTQQYKKEILELFKKSLLPVLLKSNPKQQFPLIRHYYNTQKYFNKTAHYPKEDNFVIARGGSKKGQWIYSLGKEYSSPKDAVSVYNNTSIETKKQIQINKK